ncbi:MAG: GNAT family N-acetyltransferase [Candidatus Omnitrophota bacterium]
MEEIFKRVESGQEYDTGELAGLFDRIILNVLTQFGIKDDVMVVGLGSYGRGVVPIGSDCDAVFIVRGAFPGLVKKDIQERVVWILEQIGLDVDPGALLPGDLKDWPTMDQLRAAFDEGVESGELVGINMLFLADNRLVSDADEKSIPEFGEYCRMRDEIITGKHPAFIAHLVLEIANFLRITGGTTPEAAGPSAGLIDIYYRYGDDKERIMQEIGKKIKSLYTVEDGELRLSPLGESEILRDIRQFNVKQDSGGMRSLDFVLWTGRVLSGVNDPDPYKIIEQLSAEYATGEEKEILRETMDYFIKLRSVINYISSLEKAEGTPEFIEHDTIDFNDISSIEQIVKVMEPQNELVRKIMSLEGQEQDIESELRKLSTIDTEDVEEKRRLSGERRSVRGELLKSRKELAGEFRGKVNSMRGKIAAIGLKALDKYLVSFIREGKIRDEDALYVMVPIGQRALLDLKRELKHRGEYRKDLARVMRERYRASRADLGKGVLGFIAAGVYKFTDTVMDLFGREKTPGYRAFVEDYFIPVIEEGAMFLVLRSWGTLPYFLIRPGFILAHAFQDRAPPGRRRTIFERIIIPALISVPAFSLPILALLGASPVVLGVVVGAVTLLHMAANRFVTLTGSRLQKAVLGKKFVQPPVRKARIISIRGEKVSDTYPVVPVTVREEAEPVPGVEFIATEEILDELMTDYPERILRDRGMDAEQYSRLAETAVVTNKKPIKVDPSGREWIGERYIIGRTPSGEDIELGRGGVAVVYYGLDTQSGDEIVLKVPEEERAVPGKEKLPFELKKMSLLREAAFIEYVKEQEKQGRVDLEGGVVDLRDAGVYRGAYLDDKGRPTGKEYTNYYIAMGYVHGLTLGDLLNQRGPLAEDEARALFERVYDTTRKLHKIGVIHMDIKSDNIFIPLVNGKLEFGKAVLGDFGFSIKVDNVDGQYVHDFTYGTEGYVPPEGGVGVFSGRNDMYALGMTLYEMMTGTVIEDGVKAEFTPDMESALPADLVAVVRLLTQENWEESSVLAEGVTGILERGKVAIADDVVLEDFEGFELEDMVLKLMKPGQKYSREEFKAEVEKLKLFLTRAIGVNLRQMAGDISEAKFGAGKRDGFKRFIVKKIRHAGRGDYKHALRVEADTDQGRQVFAVKFLKPKRPEYTFEGFKKMIKTEYENSRRLSETGLAADYYGEPYYVGERFDEKFSKGLEEHGILGLLVGEYVEGTPVSEIYERDERKEAYRGLVKATVRLWLETYDPETQAGLVLYDLAGRNYVLEDGTGRIKTIDPAFLDPFNVDYLRDMISALLIAELAMEKEGIRFDAMPGGADEMYFLSAIPEEINDYLREKGDSLDERKKRAVMELRGAEALRDIQVAVEEKIDLQKAIADASGRGDVIRMAELSDGKELEIHDAKALVRDDEEMFKELLAAVQKVVASSFGPSKAYGLAAELRIKQILQENEVMIAVVGNEVIGFLAYQFKPGEARSILDWFAVMQEHQGKGIGSRMMDEFMEVSLKARETGIEKAWWHSWDEKSDDFYIGYFRKKGIKPEQVGRNFTLGLDAVGAAMAPDHGAIMRGLRPEDVEEAITGDVDKSTLSEEFKAIEEMLDDSSLERNRTLRELADKLEIPWDLMLSRIKKARDDLLKGNKALKEFPAIVRGLDEYALGMATEDKITYSTEILAMLPAPLRAEYVLHEAICYYFPGLEGHQTARQIQMVLFPRNYGNLTPEEREELEGTEALTGDLTLFLSAFIDVTAPPLEGPPAERKAQEIYAQARMLAPALADAVRRGAPTYDIGPSFFRDMARDEQCNKEVARILGKKGHNIYARHCAFDPTKDTAAKWFENMVEDRPGGVLYDMLETFSRDASVDPRTRMTIRLIRGPDEAGNKARRKDMEGFILRNLKLMNPDLAERLETMSEAERNEWFNKHVKVLDVDVGNIEHVNPVLDLITDIGVMELDRYAKHDYEGKAPRDLEENLVRLLNLSIGSFVNIDTKQALKKVSRKDLYRVLAALFTGNMYIMVRKIDWGSIREKIRAQNAVLKSL